MTTTTNQQNETLYFCCGNLPSEGHTAACENRHGWNECATWGEPATAQGSARSTDEAAEDEGLKWAAEGEAAQHPRERW